LSQANSGTAEWMCYNMAATSVKNQLGEALLQGLWSVGGGGHWGGHWI